MSSGVSGVSGFPGAELGLSLLATGKIIRGMYCWRKGSVMEVDCQSTMQVIFFVSGSTNKYVIRMKIRMGEFEKAQGR